MPKRLVILPTYNEAENVKVLIPRIFKYIEDCTVLVIDDGSPDGTANVAKELANKFPNLEVINQGKIRADLGFEPSGSCETRESLRPRT